MDSSAVAKILIHHTDLTARHLGSKNVVVTDSRLIAELLMCLAANHIVSNPPSGTRIISSTSLTCLDDQGQRLYKTIVINRIWIYSQERFQLLTNPDQFADLLARLLKI